MPTVDPTRKRSSGAGPIAGRARRALRAGGSLARLGVDVARDGLTKPAVRMRARYTRRYRGLPIAPDTVLFEAILDDAVRCNPHAILRHMLAEPAFASHTLVWAIRDPRTLERLRREYRDHPNVRFVTRDSGTHMRYLASASHIITNGSLPSYFQRKDGQTVVDTWHGVPIKKMGFEIPNGRIEARNVLRVLAQTDYLLSGSDYETQALFLRGHKLQGIFKGCVIQEGHPRDDLTIDCDRTEYLGRLHAHGLDTDPAKKVVLYAPTWRGESVKEPADTTEDIHRLISALRARLDPERYTVLLKTHQLTAVHLAGDPRFDGLLVPTDLDTNELLGAVDVLVTDYSSVFVDFLVTGRPIVFFIEDLEAYVEERGVYILPADLPGPTARTPEQAAELVARVDGPAPEYAARYEEMRRTLCGREDGHVTERVVDVIFNGATGYDVRSGFARGKKTLLLCAGAFGGNHISRSILALLERIDHARYDVSVLVPYSRSRALRANLLRMPEPVRPFLRVGGSNATIAERFRLRYFGAFGARPVLGWSGYPEDLIQREWARCFGAVEFDVAVDLTGTLPLLAALLADGASKRTFLVERDDIPASGHRGRACTRSIAGRFSGHVPVGDAAFARMVDRELVRADADAYRVESAGGERILVIPDDHTTDAASAQRVVLPRIAGTSFVATTRGFGDQRLILTAFARALAGHPEATMTFIDYEKGAARLEREIAARGLLGHASVAGPRVRLGYIRHCGCFVAPPQTRSLSASLVEAAALDMPTIIAQTALAQDLFGNTGRLVDPREDAIAAAMTSFLEDRLVQGPVDFESYNASALEDFERLIEGS